MANIVHMRMQLRGLRTLVDSQVKFNHLYNPKLTPPRQAWLESFVGKEKQALGIIDLHPCVFGVFPRIDHISRVLKWQMTYRNVNYICMPTRNELPGGTRKPWPQKGTGRARHSSCNSPIWLKGGWAHGPRGPVTNFRYLSHFYLVNALRSMLTIKLAQNDLKIVDEIDSYESEDSSELERALDERRWGPSVLIINKSDNFPRQLIAACSNIPHVNLMPVYGLNALSMCKHETLVMTRGALEEVEDKILHQLVRVDLNETHSQYRQ